uniref:ZP domain-containing protein n=1 Tax=Branchiostoma floridae TaxID=7739 RepID=C3ZH80_BRAFL|eukprot:XP_002592216.1 hypothetical protein BRAFLDRAFT_84645 [Branchiostoma floridae]
MYRPFCMLLYLLCLYGGKRLVVGQTTTENTTTGTTNFTETTTFSTVEQTTRHSSTVATTLHVGPNVTTTTGQTSPTSTIAARFAPQTSTPAQSVCTVDTNNSATCTVPPGSPDCNNQETWIVEVSIISTNIENAAVLFDGNDQLDLIDTVKTNQTVIFKYRIRCCYASSTFTVGEDQLNLTTCRVSIGTPGTTSGLSFDKDTLAHFAIACGAGISLFVLVLCLVATIRNGKEQKPGKVKRKELSAIDGDTRVERIQPQSVGGPRRTTLDSVFDVSSSSQDHVAPSERSRGYAIGVENHREGPYRVDEHHRRYEHSHASPDRRHDVISSSGPWSTFPTQEDEHSRQYSRFATQPTEHYDRPNDFWGVNYHGDEWDTPSYYRGIRWGPPADFDMY